MPILHWLNDEEARKTSSRVPYRLLEADEALAYGDPNSENMLIQGDNLEALKALLPYYAGQIKCIKGIGLVRGDSSCYFHANRLEFVYYL